MKKILYLLILSQFITISKAKETTGIILPTDGPMSSAACIIEKSVDKKTFNIKTYNNGNSILGVIKSTRQAVKDKVDFIIGPRTSSQALALLQELKKSQNILAIIPMASHPSITTNFKNSIRLISNINQVSRKMAEFIWNNSVKKEEIVIFKNLSLSYSVSYAEEVQKQLKNKFKKVEMVEIINGDSSIIEITQKALRNHSNFYLPLYTAQSTEIIKQISQSKKEINIYSQGGIIDGIDEIKDLLKNNVNAILFFNNIWSGSISPNFKEKYLKIIKKCNVEPHEFRSLIAFDSILYIQNKIIKKSKLTNISFEGILGTYNFNNTRDKVDNLYIREISKNRDVVHER